MISPADRPPAWQPNPALAPQWLADCLLIRPYTPTDAPALFDRVQRSRSTLVPWLPWAQRENRSLEQTIAVIDRFAQSIRDPLDPQNNALLGFVLGIFDATSDELLGGTGVCRIDAATHNAEIGYWLDVQARGRGVCTLATRAMLRWCFTPQPRGGFGFRRIHIFAAEPNVASCAVPRRLGLRQHLHATRDRWVDTIGWCDTLGWEVLADDPRFT